MPTYEYRCPDCSTDFELFQKMSEEPVAPCPKCSAPTQRRMSGGAGLLFKGSGFYITDYARGDSYKQAAKADGGASSSDSAGAKPADKSSAPASPAKPSSTSTSSTSGGSSAKSE
jgi:putative FmdB family regulatory protein